MLPRSPPSLFSFRSCCRSSLAKPDDAIYIYWSDLDYSRCRGDRRPDHCKLYLQIDTTDVDTPTMTVTWMGVPYYNGYSRYPGHNGRNPTSCEVHEACRIVLCQHVARLGEHARRIVLTTRQPHDWLLMARSLRRQASRSCSSRTAGSRCR